MRYTGGITLPASSIVPHSAFENMIQIASGPSSWSFFINKHFGNWVLFSTKYKVTNNHDNETPTHAFNS